MRRAFRKIKKLMTIIVLACATTFVCAIVGAWLGDCVARFFGLAKDENLEDDKV